MKLYEGAGADEPDDESERLAAGSFKKLEWGQIAESIAAG